MELLTGTVEGTPRPAASVVLLRDGDTGLEVLLLRRHDASAVLGGAHVFPGGKVDAADAQAQALARLDHPPPVLHTALGEPQLPHDDAAALYVAAAREAFEECGVLLAHGADSSHTAQAAQLLTGGQLFAGMLEQLSLQLNTHDLVPWSRWITPRTPSVMRKRFDTRFFVAGLPPGQTAMHDNLETTESIWLTPRAAIEAYWANGMALAPPQIMGLVQLVRHDTVASVLAEARAGKPPLIEPWPMELDGTRVICYPGDPDHPVPGRALMGPLRIVWRNGRFEPAEGLSGFLG